MEKFWSTLNSPLGLLIIGALVSGLLVQYIATNWQQRNWLAQQELIASNAMILKRLDKQYQALENMSADLSSAIVNSQQTVVAVQKGIKGKQYNEIVASMNAATMNWDAKYPIHAVHVQAYFADPEILTVLAEAKTKRDALDVSIYELVAGSGGVEPCVSHLEQLTSLLGQITRKMLAEIKRT